MGVDDLFYCKFINKIRVFKKMKLSKLFSFSRFRQIFELILKLEEGV